jgi:hypothetical protein
MRGGAAKNGEAMEDAVQHLRSSSDDSKCGQQDVTCKAERGLASIVALFKASQPLIGLSLRPRQFRQSDFQLCHWLSSRILDSCHTPKTVLAWRTKQSKACICLFATAVITSEDYWDRGYFEL